MATRLSEQIEQRLAQAYEQVRWPIDCGEAQQTRQVARHRAQRERAPDGQASTASAAAAASAGSLNGWALDSTLSGRIGEWRRGPSRKRGR